MIVDRHRQVVVEALGKSDYELGEWQKGNGPRELLSDILEDMYGLVMAAGSGRILLRGPDVE